MVLTQLEGKVANEYWHKLKQAYDEGLQRLPPFIYQTYLVQDDSDRDKWRILTIWHNRQALEAYQASVETPEGVLMFGAAGAEPTLSIYEVIDRSGKD
jgi:heme-degrading monooxygenase HmoA